MKYAHILLAIASEVWAMERTKLLAMIDFVALQASGVKFTAEEVEAKIAPASASAVARKEGAVAVLPIRGVIANRLSLMTDISGGTSCEALGQAIRAVVNDDGVKAIVLDIDSPGGTVAGVDELAAQIFEARGRKPIVAQVNARCASAAYWIAAAADEVVTTPSGEIGSIGCVAIHDDISRALEEAGVTRTMIVSSEFKGEQAEHLPLSDEAKAHIQSQVDAFDAMFVGRVAQGRGLSVAAVREQFGQGRMLMAKPSMAVGMVDRIATMDETLVRFGVAPAVPRQQQERRFPAAREARALALPR